MLFNSVEYGAFLPLVFLLYWLVFSFNIKVQNLFVLAASYVFYGWWNWRLLILIIVLSLCNYAAARGIERCPKRGKLLSIVNTTINLSILGVFKYFDFFAASLVQMAATLGISLESTSLSLILPVGISFYTFQGLSYTIDVYKKRIKAEPNVITFLAYISFFPQLVAGPIERASSLLPQFNTKRQFSLPMAVDGLRQILWGLFKKIVIADQAANLVNHIFANYTTQPSLTLWFGAFLFTVQIYGDFSGYSDMALGTARLLGFNLMRNFDNPFFAKNINQFWHKWHISLSTWFRDYVYIPLGGSRCSLQRQLVNTLIVFLLSGLWHGANYTFVAWGAYHAFLLIIYTLYIRKAASPPTDRGGDTKGILSTLVTFALVVIGFVIFRAPSIDVAYHYILSMFNNLSIHGGGYIYYHRGLLLLIAILFLAEWLQRSKEHALQLTGVVKHRSVRWLIYYLLIGYVIYYSGEPSSFIYFQF